MPVDPDLSNALIRVFAPSSGPEEIVSAFYIRSSHGMELEFNPNLDVEMGSCMKAFILAASCKMMDADELTPQEELELTPAVRVEASDQLEAREDGSTLTVDELLRAMIGVSDNTATEMIQQRIGPGALQGMLHQLGLFGQLIPGSVRDIYALENLEEPFPAFRTTAHIMSTFYERMLDNALDLTATAEAYFWDVMHEEDRQQGTHWAEGIQCFRKSGSVIWPSVNAQAVCGVLRSSTDHITFALALNRRPGGDDIAEATMKEFGPRFTAALKMLERALVAG